MSDKISYGDAVQIYFLELNNSKEHKLMGPICARVFGCIAVPSARVVDATKSAFDGLTDLFGILAYGLLFTPVNGVLWLIDWEKIPNCFSVSRGVNEIWLAFVQLGKVPVDFFSNLLAPNWNQKKPNLPDGDFDDIEKKKRAQEEAEKKAKLEKEKLAKEAAEKQAAEEKQRAEEAAAEAERLAQEAAEAAEQRRLAQEAAAQNGRPDNEVVSKVPIYGQAFVNNVRQGLSAVQSSRSSVDLKAEVVDQLRSAVAYEDPQNLTPALVRQAADEIDPALLQSTVLNFEELFAQHSHDPEKLQDAAVASLENKHQSLLDSQAPKIIFAPAPRAESMAERIDRENAEAAARQAREASEVEQLPPSDRPPSPSPAPSNPWSVQLKKTGLRPGQ